MLDINQNITDFISYISNLTGGNEFATGMLLTLLTGWAAYLAKSIPEKIHRFIMKHVTTVIVFQSDTRIFHKMMVYFDKSNISNQSRFLKVTNGMWAEGNVSRGLGYGIQYLKINGKYVRVVLELIANINTPIDKLTIIKLGRSHNFFIDLIDIITKEDEKENITEMYTWDNGLTYQLYQPIRTLNTIYMNTVQKNKIIDAIQNFLENKTFYEQHGIPYQLGILLYGEPGTGKTSIIRAIAGHLGYDIVSVDTTSQLVAACSTNLKNKIVVAEEIDTFGMTTRKNIAETQEIDDIGKIKNSVLDKEKSQVPGLYDELSRYTLGQTLKALDGLFISSGRILIMTTNDANSLDPGLIRPGRIDVAIHIGYFDMNALKEMIFALYPDTKPEHAESLFNNRKILDKVTGASIQDVILKGFPIEKTIEEFTEIKER